MGKPLLWMARANIVVGIGLLLYSTRYADESMQSNREVIQHMGNVLIAGGLGFSLNPYYRKKMRPWILNRVSGTVWAKDISQYFRIFR